MAASISWPPVSASQKLMIFLPLSVLRNLLHPGNKPFFITEAGLSGFLYTSRDLIKTGEKLGAKRHKDRQPWRKKNHCALPG